MEWPSGLATLRQGWLAIAADSHPDALGEEHVRQVASVSDSRSLIEIIFGLTY
jgi:hypothetical protein